MLSKSLKRLLHALSVLRGSRACATFAFRDNLAGGTGRKQIEVDINGWKWLFIERYSTDRRFGDERYTSYGNNRTQLLAVLYAPQRSKNNANNLNAKQTITEELANTDFSATYPILT